MFQISILFIANRFIFKMPRSKKKSNKYFTLGCNKLKKKLTRNALCQPQVWVFLKNKEKNSMAIVHS